MELLVLHPSGEVEFFPIQEHTTVKTLRKHVLKTYVYFKFLSNRQELLDMDACFSELDSSEVVIEALHICDDCRETCKLSHTASRGHLECLKTQLYMSNSQSNANLTFWAAKNGHFDCLEYLHKHGYEWNYLVMYVSEMNGHAACHEYARDNGCPCNKILSLISRNGEDNDRIACDDYLASI